MVQWIVRWIVRWIVQWTQARLVCRPKGKSTENMAFVRHRLPDRPRPRRTGRRRSGGLVGAGFVEAVLVAFLFVCPGAAAQEGAGALQALEARLGQARENAIHLLAPSSFEEAADRLEDASRRLRDGRRDARFEELLDEAGRWLAAAEGIAAAGRPHFEEALAAREEARASEAEMRASEGWARAESELERAGRRLEREDMEDVAVRAGRATVLYRRATRAARRDRFLGAAIEARAAALNAGASELAPNAFAAGEAHVAFAKRGSRASPRWRDRRGKAKPPWPRSPARTASPPCSTACGGAR